MLLYGGFVGGTRAADSFTTTGASYDPKLNQWRPIEEGPTAIHGKHRGGLSCALWSGTEMIVLRDNRIDSYNPFTDRWTTSRESASYPDFNECPV